SAPIPLEDWIRDIPHGFLVRDGYAQATPTLRSGTLGTARVVVEIRNGKPVARTHITLQFGTEALLGDKLAAVSDASTTRTMFTAISKGIPWSGVTQLVSAPA